MVRNFYIVMLIKLFSSPYLYCEKCTCWGMMWFFSVWVSAGTFIPKDYGLKAHKWAEAVACSFILLLPATFKEAFFKVLLNNFWSLCQNWGFWILSQWKRANKNANNRAIKNSMCKQCPSSYVSHILKHKSENFIKCFLHWIKCYLFVTE